MKKSSERKKVFLIGEIGINHNGSLKIAKAMIDLAKKYKFDAVKFQKRDLNVCIPDNQKNIIKNTPWGQMTYFDYKKKIEFGYKEFDEISKYCKKIKIDWFCSPWDINSLKFLKKYKLKYNKVASAMATNVELLHEIAKEKKLTFISTGMCSMKDVMLAVKIFKKYKCNFVLLHCVSTYPCDESKLNLNCIVNLKKKFKCKIGYSGHESSVSPTIAAWMLGADYIERHITLDRAMWGTDQAASLSEVGISQLTGTLFKLPKVLGDGKKVLTPNEKELIPKFRYWV